MHFLATNTIKLITTEIGQNVFSIVANVPLMLHLLPLILLLTFSLTSQEQQLVKRNDKKMEKLAAVDGGGLRHSPNYQIEKLNFPRGQGPPNQLRR